MNERRLWRLQSPQETFYKHEIGAQLGCAANSIVLENVQNFEDGHRFLYFHTRSGFGKLAFQPESKRQLAKEVHRTLWAKEINLPTADVVHPYQETKNGYGLLMLERLPTRPGSFITNISDLASFPVHRSRLYGSLAVDSILRSSYLPVPQFQPEHFPMNETAQSPETMLLHVEKWLALFNEPTMQQLLLAVFPSLAETLVASVEAFARLPQLIGSLVEESGFSEVPFFVHNDASIKNMYFKRRGLNMSEAYLIDFEHSTATHYPVLGMLKDLADLYGASAYSADVQREILCRVYAHEFVHLPYLGASEQMCTVTKALCLLGTLNFCQSVMYRAIESSEPLESLAADPQALLVLHLLGQLLPNLSYLDGLAHTEQPISTALSPSY